MIVDLPETARLIPPTEQELSHHMRRHRGRWAAAYKKEGGWDSEILPTTVGRAIKRMGQIVGCGKTWGLPTAFWPVDSRNVVVEWPTPLEG